MKTLKLSGLLALMIMSFSSCDLLGYLFAHHETEYPLDKYVHLSYATIIIEGRETQ